MRMEASCEPRDVIANRLDPWHGVYYHPHTFKRLKVIGVENGRLLVRVVYGMTDRLGIEVDALFGCKPGSNCSENHIRNQLTHYYNKGVRHVFPIHLHDNAFGGAAIYHWLWPFANVIATGYGMVIPEELRKAIVNAFYNIRFPVRFINCLLQGKFKKSGYEFGQFFINSTAGCLGLLNPASNYPHLQPSKEDLGQTFAVWGFDNGAYLTLPFLGPSSLRDGLGKGGDLFLDPIWWAPVDIWTSIAIRAGEVVNETSLRIGQYEALKDAALDPYVMLRNAWVQNRNKLIAE